MLELKNLSKYYNNNGNVTIGLHNINLKLEKNEIVAITGDSGSGKSTLLNVISGIDTYEEGEMLFYGNETSYFDQKDMDAYRKNNVSFIFQKYNIIESYTVLDNVMLPLLLRGKSKKQAESEARAIIEKVGLKDRIKNRGGNLSGGEKQRCVIARALAGDAQILACDEPTGNLDSKTGKEIIELIKKVSNDKLVLIVTHDYSQVKDIATRKIKISDGEIIEDVTFEKREEEGKKDMNLKVEHVKKSRAFALSFKNIFATPKKSTLISLVFCAVAILALFLSLFIYQGADSGYAGDDYGIVGEDRVVAYKKDHTALSYEQLEKQGFENIYYNAFYEDAFFKFRIKKDKGDINLGLTFQKPAKMKVLEGSFDENGYGIVIPDSYYDVYPFVLALDDGLYPWDEKGNFNENIGKASYVAKSKFIKIPLIYCAKPNEKLKNYCLNSLVEFAIEYKDETRRDVLEKEYLDDLPENTRIILPEKLNGKVNISNKAGGLYAVRYGTKIPVVYENTKSARVQVGKDFLGGNIFPDMEIYEASIYNSNINSVKNRLSRLGYDYSVPSKLMTAEIEESVIIPFIIVYVSFLLLLLYFVAGAVLSKVYQSKTRDYGILRTLGVSEKNLKFMILSETFMLGLFSTIIAFVLFVVVGLIAKLKLIEYITFSFVVVFVLLMCLFSLAIGARFSRKLFIASVNETLKAGDGND